MRLFTAETKHGFSTKNGSESFENNVHFWLDYGFHECLQVHFDMGHDVRKPDFVACEQQMCIPTCTSDCCTLISALVIFSLEGTINKFARCKISIFKLVSVAEQTGLNFTWSEMPKAGFLPWMPMCFCEEQLRYISVC